ncbi:MAG: glycosyltransferase family 1 protein [Hyphomonadaceae bacterium]|nr:glycosyltransferase family 1 protein [Hyphomonadaceae bacterium]
MRFLINGRFLNKPLAGVARVGQEMLRALLAEMADMAPAERPRAAIAAPPGVSVANAAQAGVGVVRGPGGLIGEQVRLPWIAPGATVLSFANSTPLLAWKSIVWIHDAHVFEAPESYSRFYRLWHQNMLRLCALRGFEIVTVSNYSREALIAHGARPAKTTVIYNGGDHILRDPADRSALTANGLSPGRFVLLVGSRAQHKRLPFAVEALSRHLPQDIQIAVVGLGQKGAYAGEGGLSADARVKILPMLSDAQLRALYEAAGCVAIPSVLEGFSLPAAEAMWCGAPLVLCNRTALPEVGGPAALFFEADDAAGLAARVQESFDPAVRARLSTAALQQREKFCWRASARQLIEQFLT